MTDTWVVGTYVGYPGVKADLEVQVMLDKDAYFDGFRLPSISPSLNAKQTDALFELVNTYARKEGK